MSLHMKLGCINGLIGRCRAPFRVTLRWINEILRHTNNVEDHIKSAYALWALIGLINKSSSGTPQIVWLDVWCEFVIMAELNLTSIHECQIRTPGMSWSIAWQMFPRHVQIPPMRVSCIPIAWVGSSHSSRTGVGPLQTRNLRDHQTWRFACIVNTTGIET